MLRAFKPASPVMSVWDRAVDPAARMVMRKIAKRRGEKSVCMASISLDLRNVKERPGPCAGKPITAASNRRSEASSPGRAPR